MKRIRALDNPTPGLADYLDCERGDADWDGFGSYRAGAAKSELIEALQNIQHGLCAYCEIDLDERNRQIEHVVPRSHPRHGAAKAPDAGNMIACCLGGTKETAQDSKHYLPPIKDNTSCGQKKGNGTIPDFVDPRNLPCIPSLIRVGQDGRIEADEQAVTGRAAKAVNEAIGLLGLNVERLRLAREERWLELEEYGADEDVMLAAAREELLPDRNGKLPKFFTTSRSYFGPVGEHVLAQKPRAWV